MLVLLGIATNEIIQWGRRYQAKLNDRDTYLHALLAISDRPSNREPPGSMRSARTS